MKRRAPGALALLIPALAACGGDESDARDISLSGSWRASIWFQTDTCGLPEGYNAEIMTLEFTQAGTDVTVTDPDGDTMSGVVSGGNLELAGTKLHVDDDTGCETISTLSVTASGCDAWLQGSLANERSLDAATCGSGSTCEIESSLQLTRLFDPADVPALLPDQDCGGDSSCIGRDTFGKPAESDYVLPYPAGVAYLLSQPYCYQYSSHKQQLAYDFAMPLLSEVTAARAGVVREMKEDSPDEGDYPLNYILVEHEDGTIAFYAHLKLNGVLVEVDEEIEAGQHIAYSGSSGNTEPHLHFGVYAGYPPQEGQDRAVNFKNATGKHDFRGGLVMFETYTAE